jgi:ISXO2-like transposase domain
MQTLRRSPRPLFFRIFAFERVKRRKDEIDETYIGGKNANRPLSKRFDMRGRGPVGKTAVIGAIARKGNVVCRVIEDTSSYTANKFIREMVSHRVSLVAGKGG